MRRTAACVQDALLCLCTLSDTRYLQVWPHTSSSTRDARCMTCRDTSLTQSTAQSTRAPCLPAAPTLLHAKPPASPGPCAPPAAHARAAGSSAAPPSPHATMPACVEKWWPQCLEGTQRGRCCAARRLHRGGACCTTPFRRRAAHWRTRWHARWSCCECGCVAKCNIEHLVMGAYTHVSRWAAAGHDRGRRSSFVRLMACMSL